MKNKVLFFLPFLIHFTSYGQTNISVEQDSLGSPTIYGAIKKELGIPNKQQSKLIRVFLDSKYENATKFNGSELEQSQFKVVQSRVFVQGEYKDKLSYALRYRLNEPDGSKALEFAFLDYKINSHWSVSMGKLFTAWGSTELSYNSADLYMFSNIISNAELFAPGFSVSYEFDNQLFKLQFISPGKQYVSQAHKDKAYAGLFLWEGLLFKEHLKTRYGYGLFQHDANKFYSWVTLGNRLTINNFMMELDWIYGASNLADKQLDDMLGDHKLSTYYVRDNVTMLSFKYRLNKVVPYIKLMYNYRKDLQVDTSYSYSGVSAVVEYYPFSDPTLKDFRLFGGYNFYQYHFKDKVLNNKDQHLIAIGLRWMVPLF
ncbi:porin [Myroides sp. LJL115]